MEHVIQFPQKAKNLTHQSAPDLFRTYFLYLFTQSLTILFYQWIRAEKKSAS